MKITDDILMAYVDRELNAEQAAEVERALKTDATLAARLERHRALRSRLKSEFDPIVDEPIPDRLAALIVGAPASKITDLAAVRAQKHSAAKQDSTRSWTRSVLPIAASIALGVLIGFLSFNGAQKGSQIVAVDGTIADDALRQALNKGLASKPELTPNVRLGVSYRAKSGEYCRSFNLIGGNSMTGIACRTSDTQSESWHIRMLTATPASNSGAIRTAASDIPKEIIDIANAEMQGDALDAEQEAQMVHQGWKK